MLSAIDLKSCKGVRKLSFLTCYDYQLALWMNRTRLDGVLVGDSLSQVLYGLDHTSDIGMGAMVNHTHAVRKGLSSMHLMADLPYISGGQDGEVNDDVDAVMEAIHCFKEVGVDSIKIENPLSQVVKETMALGIPVCGHIGLTPQTNHAFKKQGKDLKSANKIFDDAMRLDELGCFALVLEAIPDELAQKITQSVSAITIGIASGKFCDAQILVHYDLLGLTYKPKKFIHPKTNWGEELVRAVDEYVQDVEESTT